MLNGSGLQIQTNGTVSNIRGVGISFHRVSILKGPENTLFSRFYFHLALVTLFSPPFEFKTPSRHSFHPFSKSFGLCESLFTRFQRTI